MADKRISKPGGTGVGRGRRVQVESRSPNISVDTFKARDVPTLRAQNRESQASNYQRLASALGSFSSAVQKAGSFAKEYEEHARKEAEKAEREKKRLEAAKKRAARKGSGGKKKKAGEDTSGRFRSGVTKAEQEGPYSAATKSEKERLDARNLADPDPERVETFGGMNATGKIYDNTVEARRELIPQLNENLSNELTDLKNNDFMVDVEDEHGEPTGQKRPITREELQLQINETRSSWMKANRDNKIAAIEGDKVIERHGDKVLSQALRAEGARRKLQAENFSKSEVAPALQQLHKNGATPDQMVQAGQAMIQEFHDRNETGVSPQDSANLLMDSGETLLRNEPTGDNARTVIALIQGSPNREGGVSSLLKHPQYGKQAKKLFDQSARILIKENAEAKGELAVDNYFKARAGGRTGLEIEFKDVVVTPIKGRPDLTYTVPAKAQRASFLKKLKDRALTIDGVIKRDLPPEQAASRIVEAISATGLVDDDTKLIFDQVRISEDGIQEGDPSFEAALVYYSQMRVSAPHMITTHVTDRRTREALELAYQLQEAGVVKDHRDLIAKINLDTNTPGGVKLAKNNEAAVNAWSYDGLTAQQEQLVKRAIRLEVYGQVNTPSDLKTRMDQIAESLKASTPTLNDMVYTIPSKITDQEAFSDALDKTVSIMAKQHGLDPAKVYIKRTHGGYWLMNKDTRSLAFSRGDGSKGDTIFIGDDSTIKVHKAKQEAERRKTKERQAILTQRSQRVLDADSWWEKQAVIMGGELYDLGTGISDALSGLVSNGEKELEELNKILNEK